MNLREFLNKNNITLRQFADLVDCSETMLQKVLRGKDMRLTLALRIEKHTYGQVRIGDLLQPLPLRNKRHKPYQRKKSNASPE